MKQALAAAARDPALGGALALHRQGKLAEAILAYQEILQSDQNNADAAFLCGMAALQAQAYQPAANLFIGAIQIDPIRADFHANLGLAQAQSGNLEAAPDPLIRAMLLSPAEPSIAFNLGQLVDQAGRREQAYTAFRASAHLQPGHVLSWIEFGAVARLTSRPEVSNIALLRALKLDPQAPRAWFNIAMLRADQGLDDDAETGFRRAMELDPAYSEATVNLGNHLRRLKRRDEARTVLLEGIRRHRLVAGLWAGLSAVDFDHDRVEDAGSAARRACLLDPGLVDGTANLAQSLHRTGVTGEAVRLGERARLLAPTNRTLQFNLATYLLGDGRLGAGWDAYEARFARTAADATQGLPGLGWVSGPPPGKRLLVAAEQGLGDEFLFATCLPDLLAMWADKRLDALAVECDSRLIPLFQRSFPDLVVFGRLSTRQTSDRPADYSQVCTDFGADYHVFAGSLPGLFRRDRRSFAPRPPGLTPDPDRIAYWRALLSGESDAPVFGLTWRSMSQRDKGDVYYPPIPSLAPILSLPGIRFVTLQYDDPEPELAQIEQRFGIDVIRPPGLDPMNDLDEVAALIAATSGMVSAYTAALTLAGALGVPAYTATYGYYWPTLGSGALPWYPSVSIEMRTGTDGWEQAIDRLAVRFAADLRARSV
ncbi:MAG: tetratricopeptide repeat protein [Proteobacteria bacterium]|nr:tetratricopeptide repeat protein [Pseudomonadota bacterium]MDA1309300.1 tetratricopeptide repeat protein [Pseudomonadota bacterium]